MTDQQTVPFGARAERSPHIIDIEAGSVTYDPNQQVNVVAGGQLWCLSSEMPATCTNTNYDSKNDDTSDPYRVV
ncbi:hypothetical protein [Tenggerimyces flavus]|uniref:ATP-grasp-modified RiPP n=1 Tax=Tenggerimyces flavus TaxID=1708749 RepID=A0ABV7Y794_9ACTN|nr:hypothetical protein [Tenggerimyces flavus]MBM7785077.1 putative ATP-grasp target RiPP [Tenggerimyces flavus]